MSQTVSQFLRFAASGASSYLLSLLVLYILTDFVGLHFVLSACASLVLVTLWSFALNRRFAFPVPPQPGQLARHVTLTLSSFGLALLAMAELVNRVGFHYLLANGFVSACFLLVNFTIAKIWVFTSERPPGSIESAASVGSQRHT